MSVSTEGSYLTPKMLLTLVEKYVFRNLINQKFKNAITKLTHVYVKYQIPNEGDTIEVLNLLFEDSSEMTDLYGSAQQLMMDLYALQNFPDNGKFLGVPNSLNYKNSDIRVFKYRDMTLIAKNDLFIYFYQKYKSERMPWVVHSLGNVFAQLSRDSFELVDFELWKRQADAHFENESEAQFMAALSHPDAEKLLPYTYQQVYEMITNFYDKDHAAELLATQKRVLEEFNKSKPFEKNKLPFLKCLLEHAYWANATCTLFPSVFPKVPFVRMFQIEEDFVSNGGRECFCLAKELENALEIVMRWRHGKPVPKGLFAVETTEDRVLGIIKIVEWEVIAKTLNILNLFVHDIFFITYPLNPTSRGNYAPINSPYGTYCKLANHAFHDVFEQVSLGMRLFQAVSKENFTKIIDWFDQINEVFSVSRNYRYFIETWKIEKIIDQAYEHLQQYITEPIYKIPEYKKNVTKYEALKELYNFSPNFENQEFLKSSYSFHLEKCGKMILIGRDVQKIYAASIFDAFASSNDMYSHFYDSRNFEKPQVQGVGIEEYAEVWKEALMKILPGIPTDEFIEYGDIEEMIGEDEEMAKFESSVFFVHPHGRSKILCETAQLYTELFETFDDGYIIKRRNPLKTNKKVGHLMPEDLGVLEMHRSARGKVFLAETSADVLQERMEKWKLESFKNPYHVKTGNQFSDAKSFMKLYIETYLKKMKVVGKV